jgi:hypothetical protein
MTASKRLVKRNCEYSGRLFLEGETVYVSGPYSFGRYMVFNSEKKHIYTGQIDEDHFPYPDLIIKEGIGSSDNGTEELREALKAAVNGLKSARMLAQTDYYEQYFDNLLYRCRKLIGD